MSMQKQFKKTAFIDCRGKTLELGKRTLIMGILNVTPDSFSDGGKYYILQTALDHATQLINEGADILDIGAESTRPGHQEISADEEWGRLEPVLKELVKMSPIPLSLDTQKAAIAEKALDLGVHIINDIWGLQKDAGMAQVVGAYKSPVVIMHNKHDTHYRDLIGEILRFLARSIDLAIKSGVPEDQIIIDPGIGFGKTTEQNIEVIRRLDELKSLGFPVLLGVSRKSVIGKTLNLPVEERLEPTIALGILGIVAGIDILRVHDVLPHKKATLMADIILGRSKGENDEI